MSAPNALAIASLAYGLPSTEIEFLREVGREEWERGHRAVMLSGLTGLLSAAVEDGAVILDEEQQAELAESNLDAQRAALRLEQRLLAVSEVLERLSIAHRVLKG